MTNVAFQIVRGVGVVVTNTNDPDKAEWDGYLAMATTGMKTARSVARFKQLVISDGGGPNAAQRKAWVELGKQFGSVSDMRVAIVSNSIAVRGIVTAFHWLGAPQRSFSPDQLEGAFAHLDLSGDVVREICEAIPKLAATVEGGVKSAATAQDFARLVASRA